MYMFKQGVIQFSVHIVVKQVDIIYMYDVTYERGVHIRANPLFRVYDFSTELWTHRGTPGLMR